MIVVIDNYDSFTYNLVQYIGELGEELKVYRNDQIGVDKVKMMNPKSIIISPGPCTPKEAGISIDIVRELKGEVPILGVCLGHQSIAEAFNGKVVRANKAQITKEVHKKKVLKWSSICINLKIIPPGTLIFSGQIHECILSRRDE